MRKLIAAVALLCLSAVAAAVASAETVTLGFAQCGPYRVCNSVPNDAGAAITVNAYIQGSSTLYHPGVDVTINGVTYSSAAGNPSSASPATITNLDLITSGGAHVLLNAVLTHHAKYVNAGRAHYWNYWWTLDSATVFVP